MTDKDSLILKLLRERRSDSCTCIRSAKKPRTAMLGRHRKRCYSEAAKWVRLASMVPEKEAPLPDFFGNARN